MSTSPVGCVYLVCFEAPIGDPANPKGSAGHYLGWADDVDARMAEHRAGRGARILAACVARGIAFDVVRTWAGADRSFERRIKRHHNAWRLCPRCGSRRGGRTRPGPSPTVSASAGAP
jgi:predicted GIY-YIG superfamily endonuclease